MIRLADQGVSTMSTGPDRFGTYVTMERAGTRWNARFASRQAR
jgi:hypothetical protein